MSKVYSFRLDENNPREAQAMEVIEAWVSQGYSLRYVITEALLKLKARENNDTNLNFFLEEIREMIKGNDPKPVVVHTNERGLSLSFEEAVKKTAKSGICS